MWNHAGRIRCLHSKRTHTANKIKKAELSRDLSNYLAKSQSNTGSLPSIIFTLLCVKYSFVNAFISLPR